MKILNHLKLSLFGLFILLIASEFYLRFRMVKKNCTEKKYCDYSKIFSLRYLDQKKDPLLDLLEFDKNLGYLTKKNYEKNIIYPNQSGSIKVTLDSKGFRKSSISTKSKFNRKRILTIGGDITFGTNSSNENTWQSCLNNQQNKFIFENAGIPHYGTAQSLFRLKKEINLDLYDAVIVASDVLHDFRIDRHKYHYGYPVPRLNKTNNELDFDNKTFSKLLAPRFSKKPKSNLLLFAANSELLHRAFIKIGNKRYDPRHIANNSISYFYKSYYPKTKILKWTIDETKRLGLPVYWVLGYRYYTKLSHSKFIDKRSQLIKVFSKENIPHIDIFDKHLIISKRKFNKKQIIDSERPKDSFLICKSILNSKFLNDLN